MEVTTLIVYGERNEIYDDMQTDNSSNQRHTRQVGEKTFRERRPSEDAVRSRHMVRRSSSERQRKERRRPRGQGIRVPNGQSSEDGGPASNRKTKINRN